MSALAKALLVASIALPLGACSEDAQTGGAEPLPPVRVAAVERRDVPVTLGAIGQVQSLASVVLKPQVAGMLQEVHFEEGDEVRAGDLLLELDKRPFEADVRAAAARLARDETLAKDAREEASQFSKLTPTNAVSERQVASAQAKADAADATVAADEAALETAKLRLEYCSIRAPFDGRTGALLARPGSVLKADETELVRLNRMAPIRVSFAVPQRHLAEIRARNAKAPLTASVTLPDGGEPEVGKLAFVDNAVDSSTGTIRLMASFPNDDRRLWPGLYVDVELTVALEEGVLVAPSRAVQTGQVGDSVFVLKDDGTVEQRAVEIERTRGSIAVVAKGLDEGETVVTEGQLRLVPGAKAKVVEGGNERVAASGS